jgi:alanyl-tRNA synthetase
MGDQGPCGPCSEIHVDLRSEQERASVDGKTLVNSGHPQVIEIWNNVFMQFNRKADGSLETLPAKHVDTGMGFERLCMALQGKTSNYDTDVFTPLLTTIESISGLKYERSMSKKDIAMRVVADHVRAVSFAIADGQLPGSGGAGYVIRRILRRAIRYGYSFLDIKEPFIYRLVQVLADEMGDFFPEIRSGKQLVSKVVREEEDSFLRTLANGIQLLEDILSKTEGAVIDGKIVFELYDTFGFPVDLTALIAAESNKHIDQTGFESELQKQKDRSRAATKLETEDWVIVADGGTSFVGYDQWESECSILRYRKIKAKGKESFQLVLNRTPFYAESGGQVGDTGSLTSANDIVRIVDTKKENNLIVHFTDALPENVHAIFVAKVDGGRRTETMANHSATHLLHEALREVLGTHVEQKGSLVHPDYLRFDFSHFSKMTDEEVERVERLVNDRIRENLALQESRDVPIDEARNSGAMMLFGEKYGDYVRMIRFGNSIELCGGTHVASTGCIGLFKITSEAAVAAGIRRIEAISSEGAFRFIHDELTTLQSIRETLKSKDAMKSITELQQRLGDLQKQLEKLNKEKAAGVKKELLEKFQTINGVSFLAEMVNLDAAELKDIAFQLKNEKDNLFAVFGSEAAGKATITCVIGDQLVKDKQLNASNIVRELAKEINGGGGGQAFFATAGGSDASGLNRALEKAAAYIA